MQVTISLLKDLTQLELPGKLCLWHRKIPGANFVSLRLLVMVGFGHDDIKDAGLAHFVEHLAANYRNEKNGARRLFEEIKQAGGNADAVTTPGATVFTADVPKYMLGRWFELLANLLCRPDFSTEAIEREKGVIGEESRTHHFLWPFSHDLLARILGDCALAYGGVGTAGTLKKMDAARAESFFRRHYVTNKMTLICVGDVDLQEIVAEISQKWASFPRNEEGKTTYRCYESSLGFVKIVEGGLGPLFVSGYKVCGYLGERRYYNSLGFLQTYLEQRLVDFARDRGILYDLAVAYVPFSSVGLFFVLTTLPRRGRRILRRRIAAEITRLRTDLVPASDFEKHKELILNQLAGLLQGPKEYADTYAMLAEVPEAAGGLREPAEVLSSLAPSDIKATAELYFVRDREFLVTGVSRLLNCLALLLLVPLGLAVFGPLAVVIARDIYAAVKPVVASAFDKWPVASVVLSSVVGFLIILLSCSLVRRNRT